MVIHFDSFGNPNIWLGKVQHIILWYILIAVLNGAVGLAPLIMKKVSPSLWSIPYRDYWTQIPERIEKVKEVVSITLNTVFFLMNLIMLFVYQIIVEFNTKGFIHTPEWPLYLLSVLMVIFALFPLFFLWRRK